MQKTKPVRTLWHGNVKANIWLNPTQNGVIYSVNYARIYTDKHGKLREAYTFSDIENLRLKELAREAGDALKKLKQEYNARSKAQSGTPLTQAQVAQPAQREFPVDQNHEVQSAYPPQNTEMHQG